MVKPPRFNAHYDIEDVKPVDVAGWKLELSGLVANKKPWTAEEIYRLPEQELIIRHICVEGWDYIGQWSGPNLRDVPGADRRRSLGEVHRVPLRRRLHRERWTCRRALHPQTILATKYAKEPITDPFGFPLRLRTSTKLGFKNAKWITAMEVTNTFPETYYSKEGFNWFAGI